MGKDRAECVAWSPHDRNLLAYCTAAGSIRFVDIAQGMSYALPAERPLTVCSWNSSRAGQFAVGTAEGTVILLDLQGTQITRKRVWTAEEEQHMDRVADLKFDPMGSNYTYLLVAFSKGEILLLDGEDMQPVSGTSFAGSPGGLSSVCWVPEQPGRFVTTSSATGLLRVWNVSEPKPVIARKAHDSGFVALNFFPGSAEALAVFKDGTAGLYSLQEGSWLWRSDGGHTETIFGCKFSRHSPDLLATVSYDGTLRILNVASGRLENTIEVAKRTLYSVDWSPPGDGLLAVSTGDGYVVLVQADKGVTTEFMLHNSAKVYRVAFNPLVDQQLASVGADGFLVVFDTAGRVHKRLGHPKPCFGCDWSKFEQAVLASTCEDMIVRVWDASPGAGSTPIALLKGHTAKVFNVSFSPFFAEQLCSSSDDYMVIVWNFKTGEKMQQLEGHTDRVRGLSWHNALPHVLVTGSYDCSIRVWDVRSGSCLQVNQDHGADVYGLDSHPQRPFMMASSSRDMTTRLWSLEDLARDLQMQLILGQSANIFGEASDWQLGKPSKQEESSYGCPQRPQLCGKAAAELAQSLQREMPECDRCYTLLQYFAVPQGSLQLMSILQEIAGAGTCATCGRESEVFMPSQVSTVVELQIAALQHRKTAGGKRQEERLREQAKLQLLLGRVADYCESMVQLGEWEQAVAVAPGVSEQFWRQMSLRYAEHLEEQGLSDKAAVHWIACGHASQAIKSSMSKGLSREAYVLAASQAHGRVPGIAAAAKPAAIESGDETELIKVIKSRVKIYNETAQPILAACCLLAIEKTDAALQTLVTANELALALVLCRVLRYRVTPQLYHNMAHCCSRLGNYTVALQYAQASGERVVDQLCMAVTAKMGSGADWFFTSAGRRARTAFGEDAPGLAAEGKIAEAARCYVLAGDSAAACNVVLEALHPMVAGDSWDLNQAKAMVRAVGLGDIKSVDQDIRGQVLCYAALVGLFEAFWHDYRMVWHGLVLTVESKAHLLPAASKEKVSNHVQSFRGILAKMSGLGKTLYTTGQLLPSAAHKPGSESAASGMMLTGPVIELDNGTHITYSEGLMWAEVIPFSPSKSGALLNPF